jgi:hypothetical protein
MIKQDELEYIEREIKDWKSRISNKHFNLVMNELTYREDYDDGWVKDYIKLGLRYLFHHIVAYVEAKGLRDYAQTFRKKYESKLEDSSFLLRSEIFHPEEEPELTLLHEFSQFLAPFKAFDYSAKKEVEENQLKEVLKNTPFILKNIKAKITNETSIYKQVKWVLQLYYPSCRQKNKASFIEQFKTYDPDILIPELKTAIEYKYVQKNTNIEDYIDQVRVDAANYKNDYRYENFIAVLCVEDSASATEENIKTAWESKHFPNNWDLVITFI